jgi:hypothetical protein
VKKRGTKSPHLIERVQVPVRFDMHSLVAGKRDQSRVENKLGESFSFFFSKFHDESEVPCELGRK